MQPRFERQFIKWQTSWKSKNRCARRRSKRKKRYPADFSQFCFILAHAKMSKEPLDIWREWHFSDDSDLEILSELIRLYPRFRCPNSSFSPQLCIDIQYISNRCGLYRSHRMETSQGGGFSQLFLTLLDNQRMKENTLLAALYYKYFPLLPNRTFWFRPRVKTSHSQSQKYFIMKNTRGLRYCQIHRKYCTKAFMPLKMYDNFNRGILHNVTTSRHHSAMHPSQTFVFNVTQGFIISNTKTMINLRGQQGNIAHKK